MARGIGGDDGPSVWMFVACILIWYKLAALFKSGKDAVSDELKVNHASILQHETTSEIARLERKVKAITYRPSKLVHPKVYYTNLANTCWKELSANYYTSERELFNLLTPLNPDELKCVAKEFGVKESTTLMVITSHTMDIFAAFDYVLEDGVLFKDLTKMHKIWKVTGLW